MENSKTEQETLQMFFDGELPAEEEEAVRRRLETSPEAAADIAAWEEIREGMQATSDEWQGEIDSDGLFARIEAEIAKEPAPSRQPAQLDNPDPSREKRVWGGVTMGFALAAAILLAVLALPEDAAPPEIARGSKVVAVDWGEYAGTVFEVEGGAGQPLSVVWISDEEVAVP